MPFTHISLWCPSNTENETQFGRRIGAKKQISIKNQVWLTQVRSGIKREVFRLKQQGWEMCVDTQCSFRSLVIVMDATWLMCLKRSTESDSLPSNYFYSLGCPHLPWGVRYCSINEWLGFSGKDWRWIFPVLLQPITELFTELATEIHLCIHSLATYSYLSWVPVQNFYTLLVRSHVFVYSVTPSSGFLSSFVQLTHFYSVANRPGEKCPFILIQA